MNYSNGTATLTLTGVSGSVTGTAYWVRGPVGVALEIPALSGTSTSTAATLTGLPAGIRPARAQTVVARVRNAGVVGVGAARIETDGSITISPDLTFGVFTALLGKGVEALTLAYHLSS